LSFECWAWGKGGGEEAGRVPSLTFGCLHFDKDYFTIDKWTHPLMGCSLASASFWTWLEFLFHFLFRIFWFQNLLLWQDVVKVEVLDSYHVLYRFISWGGQSSVKIKPIPSPTFGDTAQLAFFLFIFFSVFLSAFLLVFF